MEEKLHFHVEVLDNDGGEEIPGNISLFSQKRLAGLDPRRGGMVRLDKLMPMSQSVDLMDQLEVGHLGPAIRYVGYSCVCPVWFGNICSQCLNSVF